MNVMGRARKLTTATLIQQVEIMKKDKGFARDFRASNKDHLKLLLRESS